MAPPPQILPTLYRLESAGSCFSHGTEFHFRLFLGKRWCPVRLAVTVNKHQTLSYCFLVQPLTSLRCQSCSSVLGVMRLSRIWLKAVRTCGTTEVTKYISSFPKWFGPDCTCSRLSNAPIAGRKVSLCLRLLQAPLDSTPQLSSNPSGLF